MANGNVLSPLLIEKNKEQKNKPTNPMNLGEEQGGIKYIVWKYQRLDKNHYLKKKVLNRPSLAISKPFR